MASPDLFRKLSLRRRRLHRRARPSTALKCNCSICTKLGAVWAFAPKAKFALKSGELDQGDYQFNKMKLHHRFCTSAASKAMPRAPRPTARRRSASIFVASKGLDVDKLSPRPWDGRSK